MLLGNEVHSELERALRIRAPALKAPGSAMIWRSAQLALDAVKCYGDPEVDISGVVSIAGVPVRGRIDLVQQSDGRIKLFDWKTTSSLSPSFDVLKNDPQRNIYSVWAATVYTPPAEIEFSFVYIFKNKVGTQRVTFPGVGDVTQYESIVKAMKSSVASGIAPACTCFEYHAPLEESSMPAEAKSVPEPSAALVLCVDCAPLGVSFMHLDAIIAEHAKEICTQHKALDVRLIEFGKGKGYLAASIRKNPPTGVVYARSSSDLTASVLEVLIPLASQVYTAV